MLFREIIINCAAPFHSLSQFISNSILLHEGVKINTSYKQLYVLQLNVQLFMYSVGSFSPLQKVHVACALPYNATDHFILIRIDFRPTEC